MASSAPERFRRPPAPVTFGHSTAAFTLQTYTHVIPGMDELAADTVARLILETGAEEPVTGPDGSILGSIDGAQAPEESEGPVDLLRFRRSAGHSSSSGGGI
jgi:hypothetical protein